MPQSISVRALSPEDWEAFASVRLEGLKNNPGVFSSDYAKEKDYTRQEWQNWLSQQGKCVFGLCDDTIMIGIAGVFTYKDDATGKTGIAGAVYIKPAYRGKGLSQLLYEACIGWGIHYLPWRKIVVSHRADNKSSREAIVRQDFSFTHHASKTWPDGAICDELWYELDLETLRKKNVAIN